MKSVPITALLIATMAIVSPLIAFANEHDDEAHAALAFAMAKHRSGLCPNCDPCICGDKCDCLTTPVSVPQSSASDSPITEGAALLKSYTTAYSSALATKKICVIGVGVPPPSDNGWIATMAAVDEIPKYPGKILVTVPIANTLYKAAVLEQGATVQDVQKAIAAAAKIEEPAAQTVTYVQAGGCSGFGAGGCSGGQSVNFGWQPTAMSPGFYSSPRLLSFGGACAGGSCR